MIKATLKGFDPLLKKLTPDTLYGRAVGSAMEDTRAYGEKGLKGRAPRQPGESEGKIAAAVTSRIDAHELPLWSAVEIPNLPTARGGFRYGGALQGSAKFHYRGGSRRMIGRLTKGWWSGMRKRMNIYLRTRLRKTVKQIEQAWSSP